MIRRLLHLLTSLSLALFIAAAALAALSFHGVADHRYYLPLWGDARASVSEGRLSVYNTAMPYRGSIINAATRPTPWPVSRGFDYPVYFRLFRWPSHSIWVVTLPLYLPLLLSAPLPLLRLTAAGRRRGGGAPGRCRACGYDLRATPDRCPECGTEATVAP